MDLNGKDEIAPGIFVGHLCHSTAPCQHYLTIHGIRRLEFGTFIYEYCVDNNIDVPEHFKRYKDDYYEKIYKDMIINNDFDNFKNNNYIQKFGNYFLSISYKQNNKTFINYLIKECDIKPCLNNLYYINNIDDFKFILQYVDINTILYNVDVIQSFIKNNCIDIITYLFTNYEINLNNYNQSILIYALQHYKDNKEIIDILIENSVKNNVLYYRHDASFLKENNILTDFIFNKDAQLNVSVNILNELNKELNNINKLLLKDIDKYFYELIYDKINKTKSINISNCIRIFSFKKFTIEFSNKNIENIESVDINIGNQNYKIDLKKEGNKYIFESIDNIPLYILVYSGISININVNKETVLNKIDIQIDVINDYKRNFEPKLININNDGYFICVQGLIEKYEDGHKHLLNNN